MRKALPRRLALAALPGLITVASAQPVQQPPEVIADPRMERFDLGASGPNGGSWRIFLARPAEPPPQAGYPVIYLLDGNATFPMMWHALAQGGFGPTVVVGLGYPVDARFDVTRRYYDLTPPTPAELMPMRADAPPRRTGGRDAFLAFIDRDLRPAVERRLPIDRSRQTLFGHSLGGLFALHVLFTRPEMFRTYVAADPSIWWNGRSVLAEQAAFLGGVRAAGGRLAQPIDLLIETAGGAAARPRTAGPEAERLARLRSGPNGQDVAAMLGGLPGLRVAFRRFEGESHGSMLPLSVADTLPFSFGNLPQGAASGTAAARQGTAD